MLKVLLDSGTTTTWLGRLYWLQIPVWSPQTQLEIVLRSPENIQWRSLFTCNFSPRCEIEVINTQCERNMVTHVNMVGLTSEPTRCLLKHQLQTFSPDGWAAFY